MKLKTTFLINALLIFLFITLAGFTSAEEPEPSPKAVIEQTTFEFSPVIVGTEVIHRFIISNKGDAPLNIPGIYSA